MARAAPAPRTLLDREEPAIGQAYQRFDPRIGGPVSHQCRKDFLPRPERGVEPDDRIAILIPRPTQCRCPDRPRAIRGRAHSCRQSHCFRRGRTRRAGARGRGGRTRAGAPVSVPARKRPPGSVTRAENPPNRSGSPLNSQPSTSVKGPRETRRVSIGVSRTSACNARGGGGRAQPGARCERANERGGKKKALGAHGPYLQSVGGDEPVSPSDRRRGAGRAANCAI